MEEKSFAALEEKVKKITSTLIKSVLTLQTELNYLSMVSQPDYDEKLVTSSSILLLRLGTLCNDIVLLVSVNINLVKEVKLSKKISVSSVASINEANAMLLKLSNACTSLCYFIKENVIE
jgi:GTP-sensing pleiotropic transcriptional regulator CodY